MSFFGMGLTLLVTLCLAYLASFALRLHPPCPHRRERLIIVTALLLWLIFMAGRTWGGGHGDGLLAVALSVSAMHLLGSLPLMTLCCLPVDALRALFRLFKKTLPSWIVLSGPVLGALLILAAHIQGMRPPLITQVNVALPNLPPHLEGLKIALVSDVHLGEGGIHENWLFQRAQDLQKVRPDLIVLVGDILEPGCRKDRAVAALGAFSAPLGVYAVRGNHDSPRPHRPDITPKIYALAGISLLENASTSPSPGLALVGIQDLTRAHRQGLPMGPILQKALPEAQGQGISLLLSHTPWLVEEAARQGVDLMLSGHTHAGQLWPFNHLVQLRYPYLQGVYRVDAMTLIVSRGAGTWGPRMRLWQPGEIPILTLRSSPQEPSNR